MKNEKLNEIQKEFLSDVLNTNDGVILVERCEADFAGRVRVATELFILGFVDISNSETGSALLVTIVEAKCEEMAEIFQD